MTGCVYELRVPETGQVVLSHSRNESLAALARIREQFGQQVEVQLAVRRLGTSQSRGASEVVDQ